MFKRILRSLITFAAIVAVYEAYVWLAVPWMEPPPVGRKTSSINQSDKDAANQSVSKWQLLLRNYFPADHWSQTQPPMVFASSSGKAMLVFDDYERHEVSPVEPKQSVLIKINRIVLLLFPTPSRDGDAQRDAIVLEAPLGAKLQFDVFRPEQGKIGQILRGEFPGRISIRSDMREAGPEDDLLIETADLKMNTKLMFTNSPVRFRMGQNTGGGRELEIRFLVDEHGRPHDSGLKIAGIDSLELRRDVRVRLYLDSDSLLPGNGRSDSHAARGNEPIGNSPVEITCSGPFHFDFDRYVASFDHDVELRQINVNGPSDQLSAQQLDIHFAPKQPPGAAAEALIIDPAKRQRRDIARLEPVAIVAQGHPVVVSSPSRRAEARGARVKLGLRDQRLMISDSSDAMLVYGDNVLRAPEIEYQHPERDAATKIGRFRATGPGRLDYVIPASNSSTGSPGGEFAMGSEQREQSFHATWQTSVELDRHEGLPLLTLEGRPQIGVANMGALAADRIQLSVREVDGTVAAGGGMTLPGAAGQGGKLQVVPERMTASGRVEIESAELTGLTDELLVQFIDETTETNATTANPTTDTAATESKDDRAARGAANNGTAGGLADRMNRVAAGGPPQQAYHIDTDRLRINVAVRGQRLAPTNLSCDGNVLFREIPLAATSEQPLEVRGGQLTVDNLDSDMHITILGDPGGATGSASAGSEDSIGGASGTQLQPGLALVAARGMTLLAKAVQLDERENRLWIDGPGKANMVVSRDFNGRATAQPFPLEISWHGSLKFDGRFVVIEQGVLVQGADDWLRCDQLAAKLTAPVKFGERINQETIDLSEVQCIGQVEADHHSRDVGGLNSHERLKLTRLKVNQKTGEFTGDGPGELRSTHFGTELSAMGAPQVGATTQPKPVPATAERNQLQFLRIDFEQGLAGNFQNRELRFSGRVQTVYGPVDAWEQELATDQPDGLPPESTLLHCDQLSINEDPAYVRPASNPNDAGGRQMGPVQLRADGNVRIDGRSQQGRFGARADWASYDQAKDLFLLKGNPRSPAQLWPPREPGDNSPPYVAQTIAFSRSTGRFRAEKIPYLEYTPGQALQNALLPGPVRQ